VGRDGWWDIGRTGAAGARYRFGVTFRRRWGGYVALAALIGLAGGIAMGPMVAARRTYSSYPRFLAGTNPSDLVVQPFTTPAYSPGLVRQLGRLPHVRGIAVAVPFNALTLTSRGKLGTVLLQAISRQLKQMLNSPRVKAATGGASLADKVDLLPAQRPAEIVNYKSMGAMPAVLAGALAAAAVAALGLTLMASVRRRRRDFALLKTLGFTRRQLAGAVAWQSTVLAAIGLAIGVPLGVVAGRFLWLAFARQLSAVPDPAVPASSIVLAGVTALVLANVVAAFPGRQAARTPQAALLRAE